MVEIQIKTITFGEGSLAMLLSELGREESEHAYRTFLGMEKLGPFTIAVGFWDHDKEQNPVWRGGYATFLERELFARFTTALTPDEQGFIYDTLRNMLIDTPTKIDAFRFRMKEGSGKMLEVSKSAYGSRISLTFNIIDVPVG